MSWFHRFITTYPKIVLTVIAALCTFTSYVSFTRRELPSFANPKLGFETRGTEISQRMVAWQNLLYESHGSGSLVINPNNMIPPTTTQMAPTFRRKRFAEEPDDTIEETTTIRNKKPNKKRRNRNRNEGLEEEEDDDYIVEETTTVRNKKGRNRNETAAEKEARKKRKEERRKMKNQQQKRRKEERRKNRKQQQLESPIDELRISYKANFFLEDLQPGYLQVVFSAKTNRSLYSYEAIRELCDWQMQIESVTNYVQQCETRGPGNCYHMWSLPNYVAKFSQLPDCTFISRKNVNDTFRVWKECSTFYHEGKLLANYTGLDVSEDCTRMKADVNSIMAYIVDMDFLTPDNSSDYLKATSIFFPIVQQGLKLNWFHDMEEFLSYDSDQLKLSAIDFGLKDQLFDEYLVQDTRYLLLSSLFIVFCAWAYTGCILLTILTITAIFLSLLNAYYIYTFVFGMEFFPFMNILAVIVSLGIGSDDAYIICKVWHHTKKENPELSKLELVYLVVKHSAIAVFVTTLTTIAAFMTSFWSSVTAVKCFSVFAGLATLINYIFMITWILSGIVISSEWSYIVGIHWSFTRQADEVYENFKSSIDRYIVRCIEKFNALLIILLGCVSVASMLVVFVWPRLQVPNSTEFQMFEQSHPFEQYDLVYKERFRFSQTHSEMDSEFMLPMLPLRFVWGIEPVDTGSYLDPKNRGELRFDSSFDLASEESQRWLLQFCRHMRSQPFIQVNVGRGMSMSNCFIDTFIEWMNRTRFDGMSGEDRYPCCNNFTFPFPRDVFDECILAATYSLYQGTVPVITAPEAGPRFFKNSTSKTPELPAYVVEYLSNVPYTTSFEKMNNFYQQVETWMKEELSSAPNGMKNGWFVSELEFYDLQRTLVQDTSSSILISMCVALLVLLSVTLNVPISLFAILTITCIIFVSISVLVLLNWKLNILESIAISLSIGLSVDFSLHYAVNYRLAPDRTNRRACVVHSLSMMAVPSLMAAITTGASGLFMLPSSVMPYIQIGLFLFVISFISWIFATFFQMSLLYRYGPENQFGQFTCSEWLATLRKRGLAWRRKSNDGDRDEEPREAGECNSSLFDLCTSNPTYPMHELENLSARNESSRKRTLRSESFSMAMTRPESLGFANPAHQLSYSLEQIPSGASLVTYLPDEAS